MYSEFNTYSSNHAHGASEIEMRVRETEKKMKLMKAIYHEDANRHSGSQHNGNTNPFRALLGIFLARL